MFLTQQSKILLNGLALISAAKARLFAVHEADGRNYQRPNIPSRCPSLLMIVSEASADGHVDFEPSRRREEVQLRCFEWIILMQLQQAVIVAATVRTMKTVKTEMELESAHPRDEGVL